MVSVKTKSALIAEIGALVGAVGDKFDNDEVDYSFFMVDIPGETIEGTMMADIIPTVFDKLSKVNPDILVEYYKKTINHPLSTNECILELYIEK